MRRPRANKDVVAQRWSLFVEIHTLHKLSLNRDGEWQTVCRYASSALNEAGPFGYADYELNDVY